MEVQIRLARESDMQSILEMSQGICDDYLPHVFLRWLHDANRGILIAEKEDTTLIGLSAFHVVDDGHTFVSQCLRVHPEYRGKGVGTLLVQTTPKYVANRFPSVQTERYTTKSSNVQRLAIQRKTGFDPLVLELGLIAFHVDSTNIATGSENGLRRTKSTSLDETAPIVKPLSYGGFRNLLEDGKLGGVAWGNTLIIDWHPYQAHSSNMSNGLIMDGDYLLASSKTDTIQSMSHGRWSTKVKGHDWVATIYTVDETLLRTHVTKQLERAILESAPQESFIFSCILPTSLTSHAKDFLAKEFALKYVDYYNFNILLFEKDLTR